MNKQSRTFSNELQEYNDYVKTITDKIFFDKKREKCTWFIEWIKEHERFPKFTDKNLKEKHVAERLSFLMSTLRQYPVEFERELKEFEKLHKQYDDSIVIKAKQAFVEWKGWVNANGRLTKYSSKDKSEISLHAKFQRYLRIMRSDASNFPDELAEYEKIRFKYSKDITIFDKWKAWVKKHEKLPCTYGRLEDEEIIAKKMASFIRKCKKSPDQNLDVLREYTDICKKYNRNIIVYRKNMSILNEWKDWCKANNRLPKAKSIDPYEADLHKRMSRCLSYLRKEKRKEIFEKYEVIKNYYKALSK